MRFVKLSKKQKKVLRWCHQPATRDTYDAIICDGAVRSGKTVAMLAGFIHWAMRYFNEQNFAICGKTVQSAVRNLITPLQQMEDVTYYYGISYSVTNHLLEVQGDGKHNRFYIFGGKDEASAALIQGLTLAGVLFDEVALMPKSFVDQAVARCSVEGSKFWFNCNPEHPGHWFYKEWILAAAQKRALYLHFTMEDNPALSPAVRQRYAQLYTGVFRDRFILGKWTAAQGQVYSMFDPAQHIVDRVPEKGTYYISIDYGTVNPTSMGLWCVGEGVATRVKEYYFDSRKAMRQKTDEEYYADLEHLAGNHPIERVIVDPSAASFILCIRRHGKFKVQPAKNNVLAGIRMTAQLLSKGQILAHSSCSDWRREIESYIWEPQADGDRVVKENDHAMDEMRYLVYTVLRHKREFGLTAAPQKQGWQKQQGAGVFLGGWGG